MAEFGASVTEAPEVPNAITPKGGIVKEPVGIQAATNIFAGIRELRAGQKQNQSDAFLADFTNRQLALVQAVDQGMDSRAARTRLRSNLMQAVNDFPQLRDDLIKANSGILGAAGMGGVVDRGSVEEVRRRDFRDKLFEQGVIGPNDTEEEMQIKEENARMLLEAERRLEQESKLISFERAKVGLTKDKIDLLDKREERASKEFLSSAAPTLFDQFKTTAEGLIGLIGQEGFDEASVVKEINKRFNDFEQDMSIHLSRVDSTTGSAFMKGFREFKDITLQRAKGEFTQEAFDREIDKILTRQTKILLGDPALATFAAAGKRLGFNDLLASESLQVANRVAAIANSNLELNEVGEDPANLFTNSKEGRDALSAYLKAIATNPATIDAEEREEQATHLRRVFEGIETFEGVVNKDPEKGVQLITEWMSTQEFFKLRQAHPDIVDNNQTVRDIVQANFADQVWNMVDKEFRNNNVRVFNEQDVSKFQQNEQLLTTLRSQLETAPAGQKFQIQQRIEEIESQIEVEGVPRASTEVIGVRPSNSGAEFFALIPEDEGVKAEVRRLNKELAPVINKNIKAFSHLEGHNNYRKFWEQQQERFLSGQPIDNSDINLSLDDFVFPTVPSEGLPEEVIQDREFMSEVERVSSKFEIDPPVLLAVIDFETGGTFDPAQRNAAGSSGTGLIQFMANTAKSLGTSTQELASLSRAEQMKFVEQYLDQFGSKIRGASVEDVYMAVLFPRAINKPDNFVLFRKGTKAYSQNRGLDKNGDGTITKKEAASRVVSLVGKHT